MQRRSLLWLAGIVLWLSAASAMATGVFEGVAGDVKSAVGAAPAVPVGNGEQIASGATVTTGAGAHAVLRFDDGQVIVLNQNTEFRVVNYAYDHYPEIRKITSQGYYALGLRRVVERRRDHLARVVYEPVDYHNTNRFTRERGWHIGLSKTGFINESGHCLVMQTRIDHRNLVMVLLDAPTTWARIEDTERLRVWLQRHLGKRT